MVISLIWEEEGCWLWTKGLEELTLFAAVLSLRCFSLEAPESQPWLYPNDPREHGRHSTICCTNQMIMSLLFAHLWSGARPLRLPVDPTETHTGRTGKEVSVDVEGSEEAAGVMCEVRLKVQGNDQAPEPAGQMWTKKEREDPAAVVQCLELRGGILSIGTPCDLLLCSSSSRAGGWEKWLWDTVFPLQETSPAFLGGMLSRGGGGPPQTLPCRPWASALCRTRLQGPVVQMNVSYLSLRCQSFQFLM